MKKIKVTAIRWENRGDSDTVYLTVDHPQGVIAGKVTTQHGGPDEPSVDIVNSPIDEEETTEILITAVQWGARRWPRSCPAEGTVDDQPQSFELTDEELMGGY